jgi:hypothetical protein
LVFTFPPAAGELKITFPTHAVRSVPQSPQSKIFVPWNFAETSGLRPKFTLPVSRNELAAANGAEHSLIFEAELDGGKFIPGQRSFVAIKQISYKKHQKTQYSCGQQKKEKSLNHDSLIKPASCYQTLCVYYYNSKAAMLVG